ncbi:MAG TPA: hypothetical protein DHW71_10655 [Gammaproteobacteria bacterium]|nr:hypothetical protein [Gammaproteobacteria bacterium]HBF09547.1 hypothetical protein [Gammaproteobacteria bacterium]HCK93441.1 hypothetical protein [Gammaproteobacteria bacterium]
MKLQALKIDCSQNYPSTKRTKVFWAVKVIFDFQNEKFDRYLMKKVFEVQAKMMASGVNPKAANNSKLNREEKTILANSYAGILSEYCWRIYLNQCSNKNIVKETELLDICDQIDLETIQKGLRIEVRSSFARNGIEFAVCHPEYRFDILGPYNNKYKANENEKDFYLRVIYHLNDPTQILDKINSELEVYLLGGATREMMEDKNLYVIKDLIPDGALDREKTKYRVIPYEHAMDTFEVLKCIEEADNGTDK